MKTHFTKGFYSEFWILNSGFWFSSFGLEEGGEGGGGGGAGGGRGGGAGGGLDDIQEIGFEGLAGMIERGVGAEGGAGGIEDLAQGGGV